MTTALAVVKQVCLTLGLSTIMHAQNHADKSLPLVTTRYELDVKVDCSDSKVVSTCALSVTNRLNVSVTAIPFTLYRLLKVHSVTDENGKPLSFTQQVVAFEDWDI